MTVSRLAGLAAALLLAACSTSQAFPANGRAAACDQAPAASNRLVLDFYRRALVDKDVRGAFETFMAPGFIEHKPDIAGGTREATIAFLEGLVKQVPEGQWEVVRSVADRDMVVLHVRFRPAPGAPEYAIADFFRVENCRIVEHWDVVEPPSDAKANPHSRF